MKKYPAQVLGFNVVTDTSIPPNIALLVDQVHKNIIGAMRIPEEHLKNLHRDGMSAVKIESARDFKFLSKKELMKEQK